eukprot:1317160-Pleurochrysis_carterae.AAC.1
MAPPPPQNPLLALAALFRRSAAASTCSWSTASTLASFTPRPSRRLTRCGARHTRSSSRCEIARG